MRVAAFIRLHAQKWILPTVCDAISQHADGLYFLSHGAGAEMEDLARRQPKFQGLRRWNHNWSNHGTLAACYQWADEFQPEEVWTFDEDELPPLRMASELEIWRASGIPEMSLNCVWMWGDLEHVVQDNPYAFGFHAKVVRWQAGVTKATIVTFHHLAENGDRCYVCPYPFRHTAVMTPEMRKFRTDLRKDRIAWWDDFPAGGPNVVPYDPDQTYYAWKKTARELHAFRNRPRNV